MVVGEGAKLNLGKHELTFMTAPMVHWPEVIVTYDSLDKVLFSADAFGKFGALDVEDEDGWACEARRYYFGIVGKFGVQVQALLKKAANLDKRNIRDGKFWIRELSGLQWKVWRNLEAFDSEEEQKRRAIELITGKKYLLV